MSGGIWIVRQFGNGFQDAARLAATGEDVGEMNGGDAEEAGDLGMLPALLAQFIPSGLNGGRAFRG